MRLLFAVLLGFLLCAPGVQARKQADFAYPASLVWTAAVRLMRVDFESPIREKDRDEGYFLFDYAQGGRIHVGSVEVLPAQTGDSTGSRVVIQVAGLPSYVEAMMLTRLERKLAKEYGPPRRASGASDERDQAVEKEAKPEAGANSADLQKNARSDSEDEDAPDSAAPR